MLWPFGPEPICSVVLNKFVSKKHLLWKVILPFDQRQRFLEVNKKSLTNRPKGTRCLIHSFRKIKPLNIDGRLWVRSATNLCICWIFNCITFLTFFATIQKYLYVTALKLLFTTRLPKQNSKNETISHVMQTTDAAETK
jgi:hypothetical protein